MGAGFRAADLVLARAGASMLGEAPTFGLPSIMVPLTFAWRYQKVNADVYSFNKTSAHLQERLGFTLEGCVRRMVYTQGKHYDLLVFGLTAEEFAAMHSKTDK
jgi:UDP-N-acetylglucosamine:LPS N-acetylglucosamine transferase